MTSDFVLLEQPNGELLAKIREELKEVPSTRDEYLSNMKVWLKQQPHLPNEFDETCILNFLRGCNFSLERCKRKLDLYFTMRTACPEFFSNRDITNPELAYIMNVTQVIPLATMLPSGRRVVVIRGIDKKADARRVADAYKLIMMIVDLRLKQETEGVSGDLYILDLGFVGPNHITSLPLTVVKKYIICIQAAYPIKLKGLHIINVTPAIEKAYSVIKLFFKPKNRSRVVFHKDPSSLNKYIPTDILPKEYGGTGRSLEDASKAWQLKLKEYGWWFKEQELLKANEALRPGKPMNCDEIFGIEGSFRQLTID